MASTLLFRSFRGVPRNGHWKCTINSRASNSRDMACGAYICSIRLASTCSMASKGFTKLELGPTGTSVLHLSPPRLFRYWNALSPSPWPSLPTFPFTSIAFPYNVVSTHFPHVSHSPLFHLPHVSRSLNTKATVSSSPYQDNTGGKDNGTTTRPASTTTITRTTSSATSTTLTTSKHKKQKPSSQQAKSLFSEEELEEQFVLGSGRGGQSVAKTQNCVVLKHKPTGIVVKCHKTRSRDLNRQHARKELQLRVDILLHGKESKRGKKISKLQKKKQKSRQRAKGKYGAGNKKMGDRLEGNSLERDSLEGDDANIGRTERRKVRRERSAPLETGREHVRGERSVEYRDSRKISTAFRRCFSNRISRLTLMRWRLLVAREWSAEKANRVRLKLDVWFRRRHIQF